MPFPMSPATPRFLSPERKDDAMTARKTTLTHAEQQLALRAAAHDAAKRLATELRRQAMDDFWSTCGDAMRAAWRRAWHAIHRAVDASAGAIDLAKWR
jgi:hypothetical protein